MTRNRDRQRHRIDRLKERTALAIAKASKRKWLVYLLITGATIAAVLWFTLK